MNQIVVPSDSREAPKVYWGDRLALQVWMAGCVFLWVLALANLLSNLWTR